MQTLKDVEVLDCPVCHGPSLIEEENGWCVYITCLDCGCHTAEVSYKTEEDKIEAVKKAARLWNMGKVLSSNPGE